LTETHTDFLTVGENVICSQADYGYQASPSRRKVLLWSKQPWQDVDEVGHASLPSGRFVAGTTMTDVGPLRVVGVCIPWRDAHVRTGRKDRVRWEDHLEYLRCFAEYLKQAPMSMSIIVGDFNQTVPRSGAPEAAWKGLSELLNSNLSVATLGLRGSGDKLAIDHIVVGSGIAVRSVDTVSNESDDGVLSDHFGVKVVIARASES
jgi:endonuclease/exonuclease/phosphatase family metal-dependent hydrolase